MRSIVQRALVLSSVCALAACVNDPDVCILLPDPGIELTIRANDGTDLAAISIVTIVRRWPEPHDSITGPFYDAYYRPITHVTDDGGRGVYTVRVAASGYRTAQRTVYVPMIGGCAGLVTRHITMTLEPAA